MRLVPYLCGFVLLSSCGGGGSSQAPIPNRAPVITDPGALSVLEGIEVFTACKKGLFRHIPVEG